MSTNRAARDRGATLPELLIVILMMGVIVAVVAVAVSVTFDVARNSEGRTNLARAEQAIDVWLPADLASLDVTDTVLPGVDLDPLADPCGNCAGIDLSGVNALQLAWEIELVGQAPIPVRVQYQYINVVDEWVVQRIECRGTEPCRTVTVLRDLEAPSDPATYATTPPTSVFSVTVPSPEDAAAGAASQVLVTLDGGGDSAGLGGGANTVTLTAGGQVTDEIEADEFDVPSFVRARTRCGGPISLLVDTSGSIPTRALNTVVEPGVRAFIEAFRDTPTQIQVIEFADRARPMNIDGVSTWHEYVDMTDADSVDQLLDEVGRLSDRRAGTRTNWEDPLFRALRDEDGSAATLAANRIVMFTDGVPTVHRRMPREGVWRPVDQFWTGAQIDFNAGWYDQSIWTAIINDTAISRFNQESFDRADVLLSQNLGRDLIFVGVGNGLQTENRRWIQNRAAYTDPSAPTGEETLRRGTDILQDLLVNSPDGSSIPATLEDGVYTNATVANYYEQTNFDPDGFADAMRAAALKDCGGTLTLQTRLEDQTSVDDEFVYENTSFRDDTGSTILADVRRGTTSDVFKTGTFDPDISDTPAFLAAVAVPLELLTLDSYTPVGWSCRAGAETRVPTPIPIVLESDDGTTTTSPWEGISVRVAANEAVSCILTVRAGS